MRIVKAVAFILAALIALLVVSFGVVWVFNPFAQPVEVTHPEPEGRRIETGNLIGNFYPVEGTTSAPAILLLGGSEGGIGAGATKMALALQKEDYAVLTMSYFGGPEQPKKLEHISLELFDEALNWLEMQPNIDVDRLGIMGISKGAEAALIIAAKHPELRAAIAGMPSSVAWQGIDHNLLKQIMAPPGGSWSYGNEPIPYLPYVQEYVNNPLDLYVKSLAKLSDHSDAIIPVEKIGAAVLLICGEADALWPSCDMARQIESRAKDRQGPDVKVLAFETAGHAGFGLPFETDHPNFDRLASIGGTVEGNNQARREGWAAILDHLNTALKTPSTKTSP